MFKTKIYFIIKEQLIIKIKFDNKSEFITNKFNMKLIMLFILLYQKTLLLLIQKFQLLLTLLFSFLLFKSYLFLIKILN